MTYWTRLLAAALIAAPSAAAAHRTADLPGSSLGGTLKVEQFLKMELFGGVYTEELALAYQERAAFEAGFFGLGDYNWRDAVAFSEKGRLALSGVAVEPWEPALFPYIEDEALPALTLARSATLRRASFFSGSHPRACARMVAFYDHWLEQTRETPHFVTEPGTMFAEWVTAFKECGSPTPIFGYPVGAARPTDFESHLDRRGADACDAPVDQLTFATGLAELLGEEEADGVLELVDAMIVVEGHASTTASAAYNRSLGERRARYVVGLLIDAGVSRERIEAVGLGEGQLLIETADGVENYCNRRTHVSTR